MCIIRIPIPVSLPNLGNGKSPHEVERSSVLYRPMYSNNYKIANCFPSIKYNVCHIIQEYAYNLFVSMRVPRFKHKDVILCYLNIIYGRWSDDLDLDSLLNGCQDKNKSTKSWKASCWMLVPALSPLSLPPHYKLQVLHRLWRQGSFN